MKYSKQKIKECAAWVEVHGLDQHGGALIKDFCKAMDIVPDTYCTWIKKAEFSEAIKKAKDVFRESLELEIVRSLKERAIGYPTKKTKTEYVEDKNGIVKIKKRTTEETQVNGDTGAAIFLLTNLAPERWANTQKQEIAGEIGVKKDGVENMTIEELDAEIARLSKIETDE